MSYSEYQDDRLKEARQEACDYRRENHTLRKQVGELVEVVKKYRNSPVDAFGGPSDVEMDAAKEIDKIIAEIEEASDGK